MELGVGLMLRISVLLLLSVCSALPAFSAGFQLNETSPSLQGSALAGAAAARDDVTALFNNPATLASLSKNQWYIGASRISPHISMSEGRATHIVQIPGNPASSITGQARGSTFEPNIGQPALIPNAYMGWRFHPKMVAGLGIVSPFGLSTHYNEASVLRFFALENEVKSVVVNPVVSYQILPLLAIGLGAEVQYMQAIFSNFNGPYTGIDIIDNLIGAHHPTYLKGDGIGFGYTLGLVASPSRKLRFGIGYRSQITTELEGQGLQYTTAGEIVPAPNYNFLFNAKTSIRSFIRTPAVLTLGLLYTLNRMTLKATAQVNFWESFNQIDIQMPEAFARSVTLKTQWSNSFFTAIGADYALTDALTVRSGIAYDQTPTKDRFRDPRIPDADRIWANLGFSYALNRYLSLDAAFSHIFMYNQQVNVVQYGGKSSTSTLPLEENKAFAKYRGNANVLSLGLRFCFS